MTVTKVGGASMTAHAQWPQCPPFPRFAVFYVTPASVNAMKQTCVIVILAYFTLFQPNSH